MVVILRIQSQSPTSEDYISSVTGFKQFSTVSGRTEGSCTRVSADSDDREYTRKFGFLRSTSAIRVGRLRFSSDFRDPNSTGMPRTEVVDYTRFTGFHNE